MCGIAGIIKFDNSTIDESVLDSMAKAMEHRGPDGQGIFNESSVGFVHRRLSIIDPNSGHQPMVRENGSLVITFNGEIYNYLELRQELESYYDFDTDSDTEVLMYAFKHWGRECLKKLTGMFAFAILDKKRNSIFIARDRVGIKPLFYSQVEGKGFYFASELKALIKALDKPIIDPSAVADFFRWQYIPTPKSIYKNVYKLEPGHYLEIDIENNTIDKQCYWKINLIQDHNLTDQEWLQELNETLDRIIKLYVRSDVPFGAFLSGGVDSSLVSALMSKVLDNPVKTFSIGFNEDKHSELVYAQQAANVIKSDHYEQRITGKEAIETITSIATSFGEPFSDSSSLPTHAVSALASDNVKMVLSGDGGDELFGGYHSYLGTFKDGLKEKPSYLRILLSRLVKAIPGNRLGRFHVSETSPLEKHFAQRNIFSQKELGYLLNYESDTQWPVDNIINDLDPSLDDLTKFQALDAQTYMVDDVLTKVDRMSMANSLEVRVPLLDHELVELAFSMPQSLKIRIIKEKLISKYILKKTTQRFYTEKFLERPKMGFGIPIVEWCQNDLSGMIKSRFESSEAKMYDFINQEYVLKLMKEFFDGQVHLVSRIWAILMFDLWMEDNYN